MTFTDTMKDELAKPLNRAHVKPPAPGKYGDYIEGWRVIDEANRIFGFDGWAREVIYTRCVSERGTKMGRNKDKDGFAVAYITRVRITACGVIREGCGAGTGIDADMGVAHESAFKEAETDAMKRALMTFGNPFGLALYDKSHANVADAPPALIDDDQRDMIATLATAANVPLQKICETAKVPSLKALPAHEYEAVIKKLNLTIEQAKQKVTA